MEHLQKCSVADFESIIAEDSLECENSLGVFYSFLSKMGSYFHRFDITHFFSHFPVLDPPLNDESDRFQSVNTINLFSIWDQIGAEKLISTNTIPKTIGWIYAFEDTDSTSYIKDLDWSQPYLMNQLEPEVLETVLSALCHDFTPSQQAGPLTIVIIIDEIIILSKSDIDHMIETICQYNRKTVEGEYIGSICRRFQYDFHRLQNNKTLSSDLTRKFHKVFTTKNHDTFNKGI